MCWTHHRPDPAASGTLINLVLCLLAWKTRWTQTTSGVRGGENPEK